jgi:lipocalin
MKKDIHLLLLLGILVFTAGCGGSDQPLETVDTLDINQYSGTYFEVFRLPNSFEDGLSCVTATYTVNGDKIKVTNKGYNRAKSKWETANGNAKVPNSEKPGELKVSFFWPFSGDYFVIDRDEEYAYALVGSPSRQYLWLLSRTPVVPKDQLGKMMQLAEEKGFDLSNLIMTEHFDCPE